MSVLVVARHTEDVDWISRLPEDWSAAVVQKDRDLPNRGREPASFLWWMFTHYRQISRDRVYGFVQGDPFPHCADLLTILERPVEWFAPLTGDSRYGSDPVLSEGDGEPHHRGLPVAACYERWLGVPWPGQVWFWPGGQFAVRGAAILARPRGFWARLLGDALDDEAGSPWVLERLWPVIFGARVEAT